METTNDIFEYHEKWLNPKTKRYSGHVYTLNGTPLKGITSVLSVIAKPALIQWAADEAVGYMGWMNPKKFTEKECEDHLKKSWSGLTTMPMDVYLSMLEAARVAHTKKKDTGADLGTVVHKMVEIYVNGKLNGKLVRPTVLDAVAELKEDKKDITLTPQEQADCLEMFTHFFNWSESEQVEYLASEKKMYSKKHWIAGTCDLILKWRGKKYIGDVKTMDTLWDRTPFIQTNGGYRIMLEENGETGFDGALIIKIAKSAKVRESANTRYPIAPFETFESLDYETDKKGFLAALALQEVLDTYKK